MYIHPKIIQESVFQRMPSCLFSVHLGRAAVAATSRTDVLGAQKEPLTCPHSLSSEGARQHPAQGQRTQSPHLCLPKPQTCLA